MPRCKNLSNRSYNRFYFKAEKNKPKLKNVLDALIKKSIDAMPCMDDDPDAYVKTISEVLKDPRQDKKIISNVVKEISIN